MNKYPPDCEFETHVTKQSNSFIVTSEAFLLYFSHAKCPFLAWNLLHVRVQEPWARKPVCNNTAGRLEGRLLTCTHHRSYFNLFVAFEIGSARRGASFSVGGARERIDG